jgi:hypothetical protein
MDRNSSVGKATRWMVQGSNLGRGEIFRTRQYRPWGPPSLLSNRHRVPFPGVKRQGRGVDHSPQTGTEVKERVELYLYSLSGSSWPTARKPITEAEQET